MALSRGETYAMAVFIGAAGVPWALVKDPPASWVQAIGLDLTRGMLALLSLFFVAMGVLFFHYVAAIEGAGGEARSPARRDYLALRRSLHKGGSAVAIYAFWLKRLLAAVDRFFGDAGGPTSARQCRLFGLREPAPLWSAQAYDRCLLLALIYPITMILLGWTLSGQVGPVEEALRLKAVTDPWRRALTMAVVAALPLAYFKFITASGFKQNAFWFAAVPAALTVLLGTDASEAAVAIASTLTAAASMAVIFSTAGTVYGAGAAVAAVAGGLAFSVVDGGAGTFAWVAAPGLAVALVADRAKGSAWFAYFNLGISLVLVAACLLSTISASSKLRWDQAGGLLLFLGLLTLANAPFDWLSLGLTRGLLRCGLQRGGTWPAGLALLDALMATLLMIPLCATMVLAVQSFDALAMYSGKPATLPLVPLFDGLRDNPSAPEFYWIWALLLTTLLPSLINAVLGCASLLRGIPSVSRWVLRQMPERRQASDTLVYHKMPVASALTGQWALGILLGVAALGLWVWGMFFELMPLVGLNLLELMRLLERQHWPQRLIAAWA